MRIEELARAAVDCGFHIHRELGPGLLESVYETVLFRALEKRGLHVERQEPISFTFDDMRFEDAFRVDLLIERQLLIELKSIEKTAPVHGKQILTYLRLMNLPLGLLMNFGMTTFKEGVRRIVNGHDDFASSRLRVHGEEP
ncbi:MAG: Fe3+ hydroxamate ABC transporter substrate-binding protein [Rhodospirillales bacterium RIFCSPLOWO2_12_FULL_58_28]|nr:MAG: Fe3+ hydroxamate ABC transporter substrate-binding protein [Rhodospirillales bacterium RIFCSPLOWO2_02_FULL_58_16]OHC79554.1 MAG: Fe3+ hydroxamate ABC transporter substrate-binding protein [Rhodospirillales bacterium RIFCSPLOWO2_12_FULL_58_28]